jgi:hypothetical protein
VSERSERLYTMAKVRLRWAARRGVCGGRRLTRRRSTSPRHVAAQGKGKGGKTPKGSKTPKNPDKLDELAKVRAGRRRGGLAAEAAGGSLTLALFIDMTVALAYRRCCAGGRRGPHKRGEVVCVRGRSGGGGAALSI